VASPLLHNGFVPGFKRDGGFHALRHRRRSEQAGAHKVPHREQQNAIELLKSDHQEVTQLFEQFEKAGDGSAKKSGIVEKICKALKVHAEIEKEIFYPAARGALDEENEEIMDEAEVEHSSIKSLVEQLEDASPGDELFDAKVKVFMRIREASRKGRGRGDVSKSQKDRSRSRRSRIGAGGA